MQPFATQNAKKERSRSCQRPAVPVDTSQVWRKVPQLSQLDLIESGQPALFSPREQLTLDECFLLRESHGFNFRPRFIVEVGRSGCFDGQERLQRPKNRCLTTRQNSRFGLLQR